MEIKLEKFEGPLDLLLHLIRRAEIDIYDIPITQITAEYMDVIANLPPDMEQMSEFLVMAATLLEIKSKMLLPRPPSDDEPEEDPREALTRRLLAHQQALDLASRLNELTPIGERITGTGDAEALATISDRFCPQPAMDLIPISQLDAIFTDIMRRAANKIDTVRSGYGEMPKEKFSVTTKVTFLRDTLKHTPKLSLLNLFEACHSRREMIVTFLALLEMLRRGHAIARQNSSFDDVSISAA